MVSDKLEQIVGFHGDTSLTNMSLSPGEDGARGNHQGVEAEDPHHALLP